MRFFLRTGVIVLGLGCAILFSQEPELPKPETQDPATSSRTPDAAPPTSSSTPVPDLIPPDVLAPADRAASPAPPIPSLPTLPQLDEAFKEKPVSQASALTQAHQEWRQLKNQVANRADVKAAFHAAQAAHTDLEKRKLLRKYYEIFYAQVIAVATRPEMKSYLNDRKNEQLNSLPQPRVRPTPTPSPTPTATPAPAQPKK